MAICMMEVSKSAFCCCLAPMQHFVAQLHSITIFEDNIDTFRVTTSSHFESIVPVVVLEVATISDWYTDG